MHGSGPHVLVESGLVRTFQATTVYAAADGAREPVARRLPRHLPGPLGHLLDTAERARRARAHDQHVEEVMQWLDLKRVGDQVASNLPYGFQKVLGMGIGLAARPRLILLDEPAAGLSAEETDHVRDTIRLVRERGISVVVIDHNMRFIVGPVRPGAGDGAGPGARARQAAGGAAQPRGDRSLSRQALCPSCSIEDLSVTYGPIVGTDGVTLTLEPGRDGGADRCQRRRQVEHAQGHHGHGALHPAAASCSMAPTSRA